MNSLRFAFLAGILLYSLALSSGPAAAQKPLWKPVAFAIVKYNDEAPKSWNIYHTEKRGVLLVQLWKRYLLVDLKEQEAYEIDPHTVKAAGENVEWSTADKPDQPIETPDWRRATSAQCSACVFVSAKTATSWSCKFRC